jgi:SAM-dependent methyltransferase
LAPDPLAFSGDRAGLIVEALCRDLRVAGVDFDIHAEDEMLYFFLFTQGHELDHAAAMYLDSGRRIWATERQVLAWRFGGPDRARRILDLASGYGRVTRHMVVEVPPAAIWVSDLYAGGVAFQERQFGVHGLVSAVDPDAFACDLEFDCILVSSLFSHLPAGRFRGWLHRLGGLLAEGGLLLFSVHDLALRRDAAPPPDPRQPVILFAESSESSSHAVQEYGTSWVNEAFVRAAVRETIGDWPLLRIPRGMASYQDLYVLLAPGGGGPGATGQGASGPGSSSPAASGPAGPAIGAALPDAFAGLRLEREADGFLEHCSRGGARGLRLAGWVADRVTSQLPREVRIRIDGTLVAACRDLQPRQLEGPVFGDDPAVAAGWQAIVELPAAAHRDHAHLSVRQVAASGEELDLYSGPIFAALLRTTQLDCSRQHGDLRRIAAEAERAISERDARLAELGPEVAALRSRVTWMEASRFWKARDRWFRLKRSLGLTRQE